ncbi:MAG TPA: Dabb family protein [Opitutaceae bacterium]
MLVHTVFFWSPATLTPDDRAAFRAGLESLKNVPSVTAIYIGEPAKTPARAVTEKSFTFNLTIIFKDVTAHDAYQVHKIHEDFVKNCQKYWNRVQVFDAE